jgi:O-antigen ligase
MFKRQASGDRGSTLAFWMLAAFLIVLWVAGGASRADVLGQPVVRFSAWALVLAAVLFVPRPNWSAIRIPALFLGASALLIGLQLIPLPPSFWLALPGRDIFAQATQILEIPDPWRPLSISPSGTMNALASLIVPAAILVLAANLSRHQHRTIAALVLGLVAAGALIGVFQFAGAGLSNPLLNAVSGSVSGNFANRNHFALFLCLGLGLLFWLVFDGPASAKKASWKAPVAIGLMCVFVLLIFATGSRAGLILGVIAIAGSTLIFRSEITAFLARLPRAIAGAAIGISGLLFAVTIWLSVSSGRAASIDRAMAGDLGGDARTELWAVVSDMVWRYAPMGTGFGTFDPAFRMSEPDAMLRPQYFNQAHNDFLQTVLEGGILGAVLLAAAVVWIVSRGIKIWAHARKADAASTGLGKLGLVTMVLIMAASMTDYPARTPMVMALIALAGIWLAAPLEIAEPKRRKPQ